MLRYLPEASADQEHVMFFFGGGVGGDASLARIRMVPNADLAWTNQWALRRVIGREMCISELHLLSSEFGIRSRHAIIVSNDFADVTEVQEFEDEQGAQGMSLTRRLYVLLPRPVTLYLVTYGPD